MQGGGESGGAADVVGVGVGDDDRAAGEIVELGVKMSEDAVVFQAAAGVEEDDSVGCAERIEMAVVAAAEAELAAADDVNGVRYAHGF